MRARGGSRYLWLSVLVVLVDQLTKQLTVHFIDYGTSGINVLPFFNLVHVYNTGAAFSFLAQMGGWQRWLFMGLAVVITAVLLIVLRRTPPERRMMCFGLALVIGGALGNLIDRALYAHVIDFLLFYIRTGGRFLAWPAFNVADIGVCTGAGLLILSSLRTPRPPRVR